MNKRCMGCMNEYGEELEICPFCGRVDSSAAESPLHMEPGSYLADRYIVGKVIGYGGFGVTYIGWDAKLEQRVAIKEYLPSEFSTRAPGSSKLTIYGGDKSEQFGKGLKQFTDEAKRLAKFQNTTGIVKVFDSFEENETAYIIMEYLEGETLAAKLKREGKMPIDDAVVLLMPIMESLETVHKEGILHRDIAPDNIFLTKDGGAKLIDFGAARYATAGYSMSLTVLIKPGFSPEEQYRTRGDQGPHTDVYSMAATLYKTVTGKTPPESLKRRVEFEKSNKDILFPLHKYIKDIPESTENAVMNALNVRVEDRTPTMTDFIAELKSDSVKRKGNKIRRIDLLRWPLWAKITVPIVAAAVIAVGVLFGLGIIGFSSDLKRTTEIPEGMVRTPNVINTELSEAESKLSELELRIFVEGQEHSDSIPMNYIESQTPDGGAVVDKMTNINVFISAGLDGETVPDLCGLTLEEAKLTLEALTFKCETVEEYDQAIAEGCVMKQSIEAGTEAAKGSTVVLTVSKGRDPSVEYEVKEITVENFIGMNYTDAVKTAAEKGFVIKVSEKKYSSEFPENIVMEQSLPAGTVINSYTVIELTVSLGVKTVSVPYVIGATESDAKAMLSAKELAVKVEYATSDTFAAGLVMSQSVAAKNNVALGTEVTITVSEGAASFTVPSVVGESEAAAKSKLNSYGLKFEVSYRNDSSVSEGNVISQSPNSGSVKAGDRVTITVSTGKPSYSVVDVTGKTQNDAVSALKKQGFTVEIVSEYNASYASGTVVRQSPSAGTSQIEGSKIYIIISLGKQPVNVTFNANGGSVSKNNATVYVTSTYGSLPTPVRDYYTFNGWYTNASGGTRVTADTIVYSTDKHTLYAHWSENSVSGWTLSSSVPSGVKIVDEKWTYTKTETTTSTSSSLKGWTQIGSYWNKTGSGTYYYANYPSGFSSSDSLYGKYDKSALSGYENSSTKREVSGSSINSYIYWHWNYVLADKSKPDNRLIGSYYREYKKDLGYTTHFAAFESTKNYGHTDRKGNTTSEYFCNRDNYTDVSYWWFRFEVYKQTYTDYEKIYSYKKTTNLESSHEVSASSDITNVKKWVKYQAK